VDEQKVGHRYWCRKVYSVAVASQVCHSILHNSNALPMAAQEAAVVENRSSDSSSGGSWARHLPTHEIAATSRTSSFERCEDPGSERCGDPGSSSTHSRRVIGSPFRCPGDSRHLSLAATVRRSSVSSLLRETIAKLSTGEFPHQQGW